MAERKGASSDPSIDDILSSIRKIISDDEARAQVTGLPLTGAQSSGSLPVGRPESGRREPAGGYDDVLLLEDMIEPSGVEGGSAGSLGLGGIEPAGSSERPRTTPTPAAKVLAKVPPAALPALTPTLVSVATSEVTAIALARLNQAVQDSVPPAAAHDPGPAIDGQGKTLEGLVREMLRPMLQDWLDRNLPPMVERQVEREIIRLTRR